MLVTKIAKLVAIKEKKGDDLAYQSELINQIIAFNSVLIKQNYKKTKGIIQQFNIQTVSNIPLEKVSIDQDNEYDTFILRTKCKVPRPLSLDKREPFISVSNAIRGHNIIGISYNEPENLEYNKHRKFTSKAIFYTYESEYVCIHNTLLLEKINIRSIFDNPLLVSIFAKDCNCSHTSECIVNDDLEITEYNAGLILSSFTGQQNET